MSALFRKKKSQNSGKTFLVIDVENGSVASGLAHLSHEEPKLFGEKRVRVPLSYTVDSNNLARSLDHALEEALVHTSEVAAYLRSQEDTASVGELSGAAVFLSAPWAHLSNNDSKLRWEFEPMLLEQLERRIESRIAPHLINFHPFARAAARGVSRIAGEPTIIAHTTGEVLELIFAENGKVLARATMPTGTHSILRTLGSHGGLNTAEARSALALAHTHKTYPYAEPLGAAAKHYASHFSDAVEEMLPNHTNSNIFVIAEPPIDDWLARALSQHARASNVSSGTVRSLSSRHLAPQVTIHPTTNDVPLMLETLFLSV